MFMTVYSHCLLQNFKIMSHFCLWQNNKGDSEISCLMFNLYQQSKRFSSVTQSSCVQCVQLFATPSTASCQASLSITNSQSLHKLMSIELVMPSISSSVITFSSCLQSFSASGSLQMSQLFASGGQSIGVSASASVLPMNTQDCFLLRWTGWISL